MRSSADEDATLIYFAFFFNSLRSIILTNSLVKHTSDTVTMHRFNMLTGLILREVDLGGNVTPCNC